MWKEAKKMNMIILKWFKKTLFLIWAKKWTWSNLGPIWINPSDPFGTRPNSNPINMNGLLGENKLVVRSHGLMRCGLFGLELARCTPLLPTPTFSSNIFVFGYCLSLCFFVCELPYKELERRIGAISWRIWAKKQGANHLKSYWNKKNSKLSETLKRE